LDIFSYQQDITPMNIKSYFVAGIYIFQINIVLSIMTLGLTTGGSGGGSTTSTTTTSTSSPTANLIITTVSNGSGTAVTVTTDTSGVALQISLSDFPNPISFNILLPLDDTTIASGSWSTTSSILTIPITGLAEGTFQMLAQVSSNTVSVNSNMVTLSVVPSITTTITTTTGTGFPVLEKIVIGSGIVLVIGTIATYFIFQRLANAVDSQEEGKSK